MIFDFEEHVSYEDKLNLLIAHHKIPNHFKVEPEDMPMVVMALNQDDIASIDVNDEGAIEIGYYGDDWQNNNE